MLSKLKISSANIFTEQYVAFRKRRNNGAMFMNNDFTLYLSVLEIENIARINPKIERHDLFRSSIRSN